jgi:hypothetical protein
MSSLICFSRSVRYASFPVRHSPIIKGFPNPGKLELNIDFLIAETPGPDLILYESGR